MRTRKLNISGREVRVTLLPNKLFHILIPDPNKPVSQWQMYTDKTLTNIPKKLESKSDIYNKK